jgi:hypothetical protein
VSFVGHGEALPALMRACTTNPRTVRELLERTDPYFVGIRCRVENGLAVFDELNVPGNYASIRAALRAMPGADTPVFRIVDDATREASLRPVRAGCVVFNLMAHRIITLQYRDGAITRNGSGQVFDGERVTGATFFYRLPQSWALVP